MQVGDRVRARRDFRFGPMGGKFHHVEAGAKGVVVAVTGGLLDVYFEGVIEAPRLPPPGGEGSLIVAEADWSDGPVVHEGWKVFLHASGPGVVHMDALADTRPQHRMIFEFDPDAAEELANDLHQAAEAARHKDGT